ncbi:hypothetical protein ACQ4PT_027610 [Festuca glaucescens]
MADAVGSAVISEAVNRTVTGLLGKMQRVEQRDCMERLEMAHIKMEAAVEASHRCKQRAAEDEARTDQLRRAYLPTRIAHATKSFISALAGDDDQQQQQPSSTTVRRFERQADGAEEFLRFVRLGGTPLRPYAFSNPLVGQLMAGELLHYEMLRGGQYRHFHARTAYSPDRGIEATVSLVYADTMAPMESFYMFMVLRLSESVDIIGTAVKTLRSTLCRYRPTTINAVMAELTQLPTRDFHWSPPPATMAGQEESDGLHRAFVQRFRPDPLCCTDDHGRSRCMVPEHVIKFSLQRLVAMPAPGLPPLKLHTYIMPHDDSPMDLQAPAHEHECCAAGVIGAEEKLHVVHANIGLDELDQVLLPRAVDFLYRSTEATAYQLVWKSKHGTAHVYLEKTIVPPVISRTSITAFQRQEYLMETLKQACKDNLKPWAVRSSVMLRDAMLAFIQKFSPST